MEYCSYQPYLVLMKPVTSELVTYEVVPIQESPLTIGRGTNNNLVLCDLTVSRRHCVIVKKRYKCFIQDTSTLGTYVNNKLVKCKSIKLKPYDIIKLDINGTFTFQFNEENTGAPNTRSNRHYTQMFESIFDRNPNNDDLRRPIDGEQKVKILNHAMQIKVEAKIKHMEKQFQMKIKELQGENERVRKENIAIVKARSRELILSQNKVAVLECSRRTSRRNVGRPPTRWTDYILYERPTKRDKKEETAVKESTESISKASNLKRQSDSISEHIEQMENELQCSICSELFINATTLKCSHSFCSFCIKEWAKKNKNCPNCRSKITALCPSLVLNKLIEQMVDQMPCEAKADRETLIANRERDVQAAIEKGQKKKRKLK